MASSSGSGRRKQTFSRFDPTRNADDYSTDNLKSFISAASPERDGESAMKRFNREYDAFTKNLQQQYASDYGLDASDPRLGQAIIRTSGANSRYKAEVRQYIYNYVRRLHEAGRLSDLAKGPVRTLEDVTKQPVATLGDWFLKVPASQYNANALTAVATKLQVPGRTNLGKDKKGDEKKEEIYNAIRDFLQGRAPVVSRAPVAAVGVPMAVNELMNMSVKDLRSLAKNKEIKGYSSMTKADLVEKLSESMGLVEEGAAMISSEELAEKIDEIIDLSKTNQRAAQEMFVDLGLVNLDNRNFTVKQAQDVAKALGIRQVGNNRIVSTKSGLFEALNMGKSSRSSSAAATRNIKTDVGMCRVAPIEKVRTAAESLNIPFRLSTSVENLCDQIYAAHLARISNMLLNKLEGTGAQSLTALAGLSGDRLSNAMKTLHRTLSLPREPTSVSDLIKMFLQAHYVGRALQLYPDSVDNVRVFLQNGTLPSDSRSRQALAIVFSDLRPDLYSRSYAELADQMEMLYNNIIQRIAAGSVEDFRRHLGEFGYGAPRAASYRSPASSRSVSPASSRSVSPSPVRRSPSPVRSVSPARTRSPSPVRSFSPVRRSPSPARSDVSEFDEEIAF